MPRPLTFGVEFEFSVAALRPYRTDPQPDLPGRVVFPEPPPGTLLPHFESTKIIQAALHHSLRAAGLPLRRDVSTDTDHQNWTVDSDISVGPPLERAVCNKQQYKWHAIEVISPALFFHPQALDQLRVAAATLSTRFRVAATDTSSLHVHVGDGINGFTHGTVRRLTALLWAFEPQLLTLHPPHRHNGQYCGALREDSKYAWEHRGDSVATVLRDFLSDNFSDSSKLIPELVSVEGERCAVDFANLIYPLSGQKRTIEFRLHAGTLDGDAIVAWVETVVGLVEWARRADMDQLHEVLKYAESGPESFGVVALLEMLGLNEQARFYAVKGVYPLNVPEEEWWAEFDQQDFEKPRPDVLREYGIGDDGWATRDNWGGDSLVYKAYA